MIDDGCLQAWVVVSVFLLCLPMMAAQQIVRLMDNPFAADGKHDDGRCDLYNVDALLGSTEQTIFAILRSSFDYEAMCSGRRGDEPAPRLKSNTPTPVGGAAAETKYSVG